MVHGRGGLILARTFRAVRVALAVVPALAVVVLDGRVVVVRIRVLEGLVEAFFAALLPILALHVGLGVLLDVDGPLDDVLDLAGPRVSGIPVVRVHLVVDGVREGGE
jgi:hypothetical protein